MTENAALLQDLAEALASEEGQQDPAGMLLAWAEVARGDVTPETRYAPAGDRRVVALALARQHGAVTSSALARAAGGSQEAARLTLVELASAGQLEAQGDGRGRVYVAP